MKNAFTILLLSLTCLYLNAQVSFVAELVEGATGTDQITEGAKLDESTHIFSVRGDLGSEPYIINEEGVSQLIDLVDGDGGSGPGNFTYYEGAVYFTANSDMGGRIWKTDGTTEGTVPAFDLGDESTSRFDFSEILVSRSGIMYFRYINSLYAYDGTGLTMLEHTSDILLEKVDNYNDYPWCLYGDGIALVNYEDFNAVLLTVTGSTVETVGNLPYDGTFDAHFGLEAYEGGLTFSVKSFDDNVEGTYAYNFSNNQATKLSDDQFALRTAFEGLSGSFDDTEVVMYDATTKSATVVHTTDDMTSMVSDGLYTFYFAESELGSPFSVSDLFAYDHNAKTVSPIGSVDDRISQSIVPLTVVNDELYFFADIEDGIGRELYKYALNFTASSKEEILQELTLNTLGNSRFSISASSNEEMLVEVFTLSGQMMSSYSSYTSGDIVEVPQNGSIYLISVSQKGNQKTFRVVGE